MRAQRSGLIVNLGSAAGLVLIEPGAVRTRFLANSELHTPEDDGAGPPRPGGAARPGRSLVGRVYAPHGALPRAAVTREDQAAPGPARRGRYHHGDLREALIPDRC